MPTIDIDLFDDAPKVGDDVKVLGKVESINEETGDVEISYDDVKIVEKGKKKRKKRRDNDDDDDMDEVIFTREPAMETMPESQTLDQALAQSFPMTQ